MGQQQILLYTLGLLVASVAIIVGIQKFNSSQKDASIEGLKLDLLTIAAKAQAYCHTPKSLDGGNHSFSGLTGHSDGLKKLFVNSQNENGSFRLVSGNDDFLIIQAIGKDDYDGDGQKLTIEMKIFQDSVQTTIVNY